MRTVFATIISAVASIGLTAVAVAASAPSVAATIDGAPSATVRLADLDLQAATGRDTAMRRIDAAAASVCNGGTQLDEVACRDRAINDAQQTLDGMSDAAPVASR